MGGGGWIYVRQWHAFDLCFTRLKITLSILEDGINVEYNYMFPIKQIFDSVTSFRFDKTVYQLQFFDSLGISLTSSGHAFKSLNSAARTFYTNLFTHMIYCAWQIQKNTQP